MCHILSLPQCKEKALDNHIPTPKLISFCREDSDADIIVSYACNQKFAA